MIICTNKNQNYKINVICKNKNHIEMKQQVNSNFNSKEYKPMIWSKKKQKEFKTLIIFTILMINELLNKRNRLQYINSVIELLT